MLQWLLIKNGVTVMPPNPIQSSPINRWIPIHVDLCLFLSDFSIVSNILPTALINSCHAPTRNTQHILYVIEDIHIYCQVLSFKWTDSLCQLTSVWLYCLPIRLDVFCVMCFIPKRLLLNNWVPYFNTFVIHKQKMLWFERISFKLVVMTHRSIHGTSPSYLQSCFTRVADMTLDIRTTAAVFYLTSSGRSAGSSLYSRQAGVSGFGCHRLERPASPRRICAVTRGFQTTTQDLSG